MNPRAAGHPERERSADSRRGSAVPLLAALALAAGIPLVLAAICAYSALRSEGPSGTAWMILPLAAAGLAAAGAAWRAARLASPAPPPAGAPPTGLAAEAPTTPSAATPAPAQGDEVAPLMESFSRILDTVEQQAAEINRYAARLDSAYREIETSNARLKEFSFKDEVTGLYNRRFFSIRLEEEISRYRRFNHPVSVVLIDLDGFKAVNDELGHAAGDETLRGVAEILLRYSRGINVICRYGGDEFAVLLVETSKAGARLYAERIRNVLPTYPFAHGRLITSSFGVASLPEDVAVASPDELVRAADEALYAAKRAGKNRVSVHEDIVAGQAAGPRSDAG